MAIFGFGKDKKGGGAAQDLVLAYLEDTQRLRTPFSLSAPRKGETTATVQAVDEGAGTVTFQTQGPFLVEKGAKIQFLFTLEGARLGGSVKVADLRSGLVVAELPEALELMERRAHPRARLNPKEGATLTALTGLFEGVGINGVIENISEGGARVRVEKALELKGEKRLPLGTSLVPQGQPFMVVKLNKLPKCPSVMELEGRAAYLESSGGGLVLGLTFSKPRADFASALRNLVSSRTTPLPTSVPPKARRRPEPREAPAQEAAPAPRTPPRAAPPSSAPEPPGPASREPAREESAPRESGHPEASNHGSENHDTGHQEPSRQAPASPQEALHPHEAQDPVPAAGRESDFPSGEVPGQGPAEPPAEDPSLAPAVRNEALFRLKKRSRAVVALVPSRPYGDILHDFLQEEGYGRISITPSLEELLELLQQPNLGLLFMDGDLSTLEALEFISRLREVVQHMPPVILAAEEVSTGLVLTARRMGVAQLLVKPYALDSAFAATLAQQFELS
jgi:CheY-like chemotaxis protein